MRISKTVHVGSVAVGGGAKITVQSMLSRPSADLSGNVSQAKALEKAGCEILRVAVPDAESVALIPAIKQSVNIPLVADIHFDYRLALASAEAGADAIRINPGNIGSDERVREVAAACADRKVPIRIGVNSGSIEKELLEKYGGPTPQALAESALRHASLLEKFQFDDIVISIKSSDVNHMIQANELIAEQCDYPLHLGVTEAGSERMGLIKSSIGIGSLLQRGIGDTIRVSLTADPVREIEAGIDLLKALSLREGIRIVSCPTCGRTRIDLISIVNEVEKRLAGCTKDLTIALMGCAVNGPGEAREADIGIAGGDGVGLLFKKGKIMKRVPEEQLVETLLREIEQM
ncbi:4-hydroxy-3-methylbut-2-en-1-yl diphosphate synthase [Caprobacter fermentans]|uniref:4-hydroxy-3-methylbut-2-en-1-yl diphosphate synthase (flavodoxin) n=1 Tax=Caproicibacter fermentans TaxID=2576756 RepID=A0A6N8I2C3_9FIRM|nr:flavodoxin-dependent (E)-4-hydroxy-3-methylbut-2-enyl-diphosphate synthase [Caproicibacter fermentans]MVB11917.1 4-hydroxy-3-methylbut-2-en-1-yl diphosphate synthase [Caproicibacter fermentans]OCM99849.1 4-hydroxy-3-methylbut-2-en-1-yl diphosphate synthase [Clostridium sp. W14A]